jgi:hypothetical protein
MIYGVVNLRREATLPLVVGNSSEKQQVIDTVIDTGFDGLKMANLIGQSTDANVPGVLGENTSANGLGVGIFGTSQAGEGVHGQTNSTQFAAVAGIALNPESSVTAVYGEHKGKGPGVFGKSQDWEGVHGETQSTVAAGVAGIQLNPNGTGAGVYGESRGRGPAGFFTGDVMVTGDIQLINADCAEDFDIAEVELVEPGTVMVIDSEGTYVYDIRATEGSIRCD